MRIKEIKSQSRRDFTAIYACDYCGHEHEDSGYDDAYFHNFVVPAKACPECDKSGTSATPMMPKYPEGMQL